VQSRALVTGNVMQRPTGWFDLELGVTEGSPTAKPEEKSKEPAGRRPYGMADVLSKCCGVYPCASA